MPFKNQSSTPSQKGQGMVEFALILTVLLGLFIGTFELMALFNKRTDLEVVTRMGARQASESWVTAGLTDASFEEDITDYVHAELVRIGYEDSWLKGADGLAATLDDNVRVRVVAYEIDPGAAPGSETLIPSSIDGSQKICTYGEYIKVEVEMDWRFVVLPVNTLIENAGPSAGTLEQEMLLRCWRGN